MVFSRSNLGHVPLVPAVSPQGVLGQNVLSLRDCAGAPAREGEYVFRLIEAGLLGQVIEQRYRKVEGA